MIPRKFLSFFLLYPLSIFANPTGMNVVEGSAMSGMSDGTLHIIASEDAVIDWDRFSIDRGETTRFIQPSQNSIVVNRVIGGEISEIWGSLISSGQLFLINPQGIYIGKEGKVDTAGFIGATFDFLKGPDVTSKASIINDGQISASTGDLVLVAHHVANQGTIFAPNGQVMLSAGDHITLHPKGKKRIAIRPSLSKSEFQTGVENTGFITAIKATLEADGNPYAFAIRESGTVQANDIHLKGLDGLVEETGSLLATNSQGKGGSVTLEGKTLFLSKNGKIDASGKTGGGIVRVGGGYRGEDKSMTNAEHIYLGKQTKVLVDATDFGDGGIAIFWANDATIAQGDTFSQNEIFARGGPNGGNGGLVEISSGRLLSKENMVYTTAPKGTTGKLLLDPPDVIIDNFSGSSSPAYVGNPHFPNYTTTTPPTTWNLDVGQLTTQLASSSVEVITTGTLTGTITVNKPIAWATSNTLTLSATQNLTINSAITASPTGTPSPDAPIITLLAPKININASVSTSGGQITLDVPNSTPAIDPVVINLNSPALISSGGNILVNGKDFNLSGGGAGSNSLANGQFKLSLSGDLNIVATTAPLSLEAAGPMDLNLKGNLLLQGGTTNNSAVFIKGKPVTGTISGDINIKGGSSLGPIGISSATVISDTGITLTGFQHCNLIAGLGNANPNDSSANIILNPTATLPINLTGGNLTINGGSALYNKGARVSGLGSAINNITLSGDCTIIGGVDTSLLSETGIFIPQGGSLAFKSKNLSISTIGAGTAWINSNNAIQTIDVSGDITIGKGPLVTGIAKIIQPTLGEQTISANNIYLYGNADTAIEIAAGSKQLVNVANDLIFTNTINSSTKASIKTSNTTASGFQTINVGRDLKMLGGNTTGSTYVISNLSALGLGTTINIGRDFVIEGGSGTGNAFQILQSTPDLKMSVRRDFVIDGQLSSPTALGIFSNGGPLALNVTGNLSLISGTGGAGATISSLNSAHIHVGADLIIDGKSGATSGAKMITDTMSLNVGGNTTVTSKDQESGLVAPNQLDFSTLGNLTMQGNTSFKAASGLIAMNVGLDSLLQEATILAGSGTLDLLTGGNLSILDGSILSSPSAITLVAGFGAFTKDDSSTITSGGPLRLFTSFRDFNSIQGLLNGFPFVPNPEYQNTPQEQWKTFYSSSFFGGLGFTIFYKSNTLPDLLKENSLFFFELCNLFHKWPIYPRVWKDFTISYKLPPHELKQFKLFEDKVHP